LQYSKQTKPKM